MWVPSRRRSLRFTLLTIKSTPFFSRSTPSAKNDLVLVSGASGFIAAHLTSHLLMNGYRVRGTVRSNDKGEYLKKLYEGVGEFEYVIVKDIAEVSRAGVMARTYHQTNVVFPFFSLALLMKLSREWMESVSLPRPSSRLSTRPNQANLNNLK
jgi:hypothetical protein